MAKRLLALILGFLVILGTMVVVHAETKQYVVTGDYLRVRLADATSKDTGYRLRVGTIITASSEDNDWVYYTYKGQSCKSYKQYLKPYTATTSSSTSSSSTQKNDDSKYYSFGVVILEKGKTVNVRKGPSSKQDIIGEFNKNDYVMVLGESGNYYKVRYKNREAYVQKAYIELCSNISLPINGEVIEVGGQKYLNASGKEMTITLNDYGEIVIFAR